MGFDRSQYPSQETHELGYLAVLVRFVAVFALLMIVGHIHFAAKDGLDAIIFAALEKIRSPKQVAVVGDGAGGHAKILGAGAQILDADGAVKQAVFGMAMQMNEIGHENSGNAV